MCRRNVQRLPEGRLIGRDRCCEVRPSDGGALWLSSVVDAQVDVFDCRLLPEIKRQSDDEPAEPSRAGGRMRLSD